MTDVSPGHVLSTTDDDSPYYICGRCRIPVCDNKDGRGLVTVLSGNHECYGTDKPKEGRP